MKLGPVPKLDKRSKTTSKSLTITSFQKTVTSLPFFQFTANLEQSGSRIPDAYSVKLIFSSIVTFYLTKTDDSISNTALTLLFWEGLGEYLGTKSHVF